MGEVASRDGLTIHYEVDLPAGATGDAGSVVLLHAAGADGSAWERLDWIGPLAGAGLRVIRPDARGYGRSGRVAEPRLLAGSPCVDDIAAVLDAEGVEAAHLAGYSMGACHALRFAEEQPHRVRSLALGGVIVGALAIQGLHLAAEERAEDQRLLALRQLDGALERLSGRAAEVVRAAREVVRTEPLSRPDLSRAQVPALVAAGGDDPASEPWIRTDLARLLPGARVLVLEGRDHVGCLADPRLRDAVVSFLDGQREDRGEAPPSL